MDNPEPIWYLIGLSFLLFYLNGYLKASRFAMLSVSRAKLEELSALGGKRAAYLLRIIDEPKIYLDALDFVITFNFVVIVPAIFYFINIILSSFALNMITHRLSLLACFLVFCIKYILLADYIPKRLAFNAEEKFALKCARYVRLTAIFVKPFVISISVLAKFVLKILGIDDDFEERISEEEIRSFIKVGQEQGVINSAGEEMINSIFEFDDKLAYEIMTPRTSVYMIDYDEFTIELINEMLESGFSRIPVYKDTNDNIVGTIYIKDLFVELSKNNYAEVDINKVMKKPYYVPESKNIDSLLRELQATKNYLAILIDEYGGFSGMVTMEDIVEEIVGEIEDEYDKEDDDVTRINDHLYVVDGSASIDDINDETGTKLESENHETMSGLFIELLGFIPTEPLEERYCVKFGNVEMKAMSVKDKRVDRIELIIHPGDVKGEKQD